MNIKKIEKIVSHELGMKYANMMSHGLAKTMNIGLHEEETDPCKHYTDKFCPGPNECMYTGFHG